MHRLYLVLSLLWMMNVHALHRRCINSGVQFSERTTYSPVIVYGEAISKRIYVDSNTELLYNVTFRVDCILKGQEIEQGIEITEAGIKSGHTACQWLDPGHFYVIFLEKWGTSVNSYRPLDFPELLMDNKTEDLLAKTCHLSRIPPLHSSINHCPNVSMLKHCPHDHDDVNILPKEKDSQPINPMIKSSYFSNENQFYLQSNVTIPKSASADIPIRNSLSNQAYSIKSPRIFPLILSINDPYFALFVFLIIFFVL